MRSIRPQFTISPSWFVLAVCFVSLCLCNMLASVGGELIPATPTDVLATDKPRSFVAPPATRTDVMQLTPNFEPSVPKAQTANFDPAQFDYGRRTYTQWCATCHGDRGQGLELWRSSWDPGHQNCTKAGCHGLRYPQDGFQMLKIPPPLMGAGSLAKFQNAFQLFAYIRGAMPWQAPGALSDTEYWAVTAYLADQHGADAFRKPLNEANALNVTLPTAEVVGGR
jgi:mono/diheme cytochrome c family protein